MGILFIIILLSITNFIKIIKKKLIFYYHNFYCQKKSMILIIVVKSSLGKLILEDQSIKTNMHRMYRKERFREINFCQPIKALNKIKQIEKVLESSNSKSEQIRSIIHKLQGYITFVVPPSPQVNQLEQGSLDFFSFSLIYTTPKSKTPRMLVSLKRKEKDNGCWCLIEKGENELGICVSLPSRSVTKRN